MNKRVPKLRRRLSPISKNAEKSSSQLKNCGCKLRRATTERERRAFFWFFAAFLECECGARAWRKTTKELLVSEAKDDGNSIIVTKSDKAFGLLLIDNYLEKWKTTLASEEETTSVEPVNNSNTTEAEATGGQKKKEKAKRLPGKYYEKRKLEPASSAGGAVLEWHGSTNCTASLKKIGQVHSRKKWNVSC